MKLLWIPLIILFFTPLFCSCSRDTEEARVKKVLTRVQKAAEEKKIGAILDHLSKSYQDPQGNDYNGIKGLLGFYFFQHQAVSVSVPNMDIIVTGSLAKAKFQAILTGRGSGEVAKAILPEALDVYNFSVLLAREDGIWKVTSATWERAGEGAGQP
jgi:hypothetical protein